jgi:hypothetical protein
VTRGNDAAAERAAYGGSMFRSLVTTCALVAALAVAPSAIAGSTTSKPFSGAKVNGGTVTVSKAGNTITLTLSSDFKVPDTPDPHWQVVDASGATFLLQRLGIKGDRVNTTITLPAYVKSVAKVQIYCAWAEAVLGEAPVDGAPGTN